MNLSLVLSLAPDLVQRAAAPIGRTGLASGWGCAFLFAATTSLAAQGVPSGQSVTLHEIFLETQESGETWARARFVAPAIARDGGTLSYADVEADFQVLCEDVLVPRLTTTEVFPAQIIISLSDRETEFGVADPDATQFFEAFRVQGSTCIWEGF